MKTITNPFMSAGGAPADRKDFAYEFRGRAGRYLRSVREDNGLTQADVAKAFDVVPNAVSAWETGRIPLSPSRYAEYAKLFGLNNVEFAQNMLAFTNPWVYCLLWPKTPTALALAADLEAIGSTYGQQLPPSKVAKDATNGHTRRVRRDN